MHLRIRLATVADAEALTMIARAAKASWGYPNEWLTQWEQELTVSPDYLAKHPVFVGVADGSPVGFCALEDRRDHWSLAHVWIAPVSQRNGVGKALVGHALRRVADVRPGIVRVESDPNATGFYVELGATPVGAIAAPMPGAKDRKLPVLEFIVEPRS